MGAETTFFMGAPLGKRVSRDAWRALLTDLIAERFVRPPCALFQGTLGDAADPKAGEQGEPLPSGLAERYQGESSAGLFAALEAADYGQQDVLIRFDGFDPEGPMGELLRRAGRVDAPVLAWALRDPRSIRGDGSAEPQSMKHYLTISAPRALNVLGSRSPLRACLEFHWGTLMTVTA